MGDLDQAATTLLNALDQATARPMPLRVADAARRPGVLASQRGLRESARRWPPPPSALRAPRHAAAWGYAVDATPVEPAASARPTAGSSPGEFTGAGVCTAVAAALRRATAAADAARTGTDLLHSPPERPSPTGSSTACTSRQIAEELFLSPRTVDAHLSHIYRKLDINIVGLGSPR